MTSVPRSPVRVTAELDPRLSRWLWLVKWLLAVPHYLVLALLWPAFVLLTAVALVAIVFTGVYPRAIFDFNVGVLRWTWRVQYYAYAALGTDRYPPFTLTEVPDYPARLEVDYPRRLSRGLVLVKWWLLAIPHYLVVGVFVGGGLWFAGSAGDNGFTWAAGGLVGTLVLIAGVVLLVTGQYPRPLYDFILGMDRWVVRVAVYAGLMTDQYPPFRLDMGGAELREPDPEPAAVPEPGARPAQAGWSPSRVASVAVGSVIALTSMGLLTGGAALLWADRMERDADGYLTASTMIGSSGYAVTSERVHLAGSPADWFADADGIGDVRISVTPVDPGRPVFLGIAPADAVADYLSGVRHGVLSDFADDHAVTRAGSAPSAAPGELGMWVAHSSGPGERTVRWPLDGGEWRIVAMNADASAGVALRAEASATVPMLPWIAVSLLGTGLVLLAIGGSLIGAGVYRVARPRPAAVPSPTGTAAK